MGSGRSPLSLLGDRPDAWDELDLEVMSQWSRLSRLTCPGCGRPVRYHLYNPVLGREETADDYMAYALDCPARQAIAEGQVLWQRATATARDAYTKGNGPDPAEGVYWLAIGPGENLPEGGDQE